ncbi:transposase [Micromonospora sp. NPDC023737]|uniref:transposase n=1 Tax=unclassified Micromonospora TaxID=2617518 RepID=UPI0033E7B124
MLSYREPRPTWTPASRTARDLHRHDENGSLLLQKYPDELRERATWLAAEARRDPASSVGAIRRIAGQLGVHPEALRTWMKQAETDGGVPSGTTSSETARIAKLEREVRELRRANQILTSAASFFAAELDRPW